MPTMTTGSFTGATIPTVPGNALKLLIAAARETPQMDGNLSSLVFNDPLPSGSGTTWNSPKFGHLVGYSLTEGVDLVNQQNIAVTNVVITPGEVGLQVSFSKKSLAQWSEKVATRAGAIMRRAIDRKKDADVSGLFTGLDRAIGADAAVFSIGHLGAAVAQLRGGANTTGTAIAAGAGINVTDGPFMAVVRPESLHPLWVSIIGTAAVTGAVTKATTPAATGAVGDDLIRGGVQSLFVGNIAGVRLYANANIAKDATDDAMGAVFHEMAMVFVPFKHDGAGGMFTKDSDDGRSILMTYVEDYGFGELDGMLGISLELDATVPTS